MMIKENIDRIFTLVDRVTWLNKYLVWNRTARRTLRSVKFSMQTFWYTRLNRIVT